MNKFDIVSTINKITPDSVEYHLIDQADDGTIRRANFAGPGTNLAKRLENYNSKTGEYTGVITQPINKLDAAAMKHDLAYVSEDYNTRVKADKELIRVAEEVINDPNSTKIQKFNARLVKFILSSKIKFGVGLSTSVSNHPLKPIVGIHDSMGTYNYIKFINKRLKNNNIKI